MGGEARLGPKGPPAKDPQAQKLVPLEIKLPRPMFQGTPKNIKPAPTLEKYTEKPRPPFYAPLGVTNLAFNKKVTSSDMAPIIGELNLITDGDKEGSDGSFVELGPGTQWVQIDLGGPAEIHAILVWHYHAEGRVYHDVVVQVADDPDFIEKVQTVYNNDFDNSSGLGLGKHLEYIDDYRGKLVDARNAKGEPVKGRYVRLYSNGNTSNDMNHYVEVEVYGKPAR
ncbi:MAG: discoidin domain-containing protein [Thermoguttaceae bacterium]